MQQLGYSQTASGGSAYFFTPAVEPITVTTGVPEPATWSLMFTGVALLGGALRMQPRRAQSVA